MKIAIVGAGLSGLAVCYHLLQVIPRCVITVYAPEGIHGGCSAIAAGLLHPYVGAHAKLNAQGREGMIATQRLLAVSEAALGSPITKRRGILRVALTEQQIEDYQRCVEAVDDISEVEWCSKEYCQKLIPGLPDAPGMMMHNSFTISIPDYLQGLWYACRSLGATLEQCIVETLDQLNAYDAVIVAAGAAAKRFYELSHLPIKPVKGQILQVAWPYGLPPLPHSINAQAYIVMSQDLQSCFVGSTYEKAILSESTEIEVAKKEILPKMEALFPPLSGAKVIGCRAGIRATTPGRHPIVGNIGTRLWYITGMGSRGLLYHALMAEQLVKQLSAI